MKGREGERKGGREEQGGGENCIASEKCRRKSRKRKGTGKEKQNRKHSLYPAITVHVQSTIVTTGHCSPSLGAAPS